MAIDDNSLPIEQSVDRIVKAMTDEEKVGQLLMIGIHGTEVNDDSRYMLNAYKVGGVIIFDRNMNNKEQVLKLNQELMKIGKAATKVPLFLAIDQEGGAVARMQEELIKVPAAEELGRQEVAEAVHYAQASSQELRSLGFNVNFAPVVDVGLTYGRSYSKDDVRLVVQFAKHVGQAYKDKGLVFSWKHFPGIGKAQSDLHQQENSIVESKAALLATDIKPFQELLPQFDTNDAMVMVSHATILH